MSKSLQSDEAKIVTLPCPHAPLTPKKVWGWAMNELQKEVDDGGVTHVVQTGDWTDLEAASRFPSSHDYEQGDEYEMAASQSREIRKIVGPKAKLIRHDGNHEYRLEPGSTNPVPRKMSRLVHWTNHEPLSKEWGKWWRVPYHRSKFGITRIGNVALWHGFDYGVGSDETEAVEMTSYCGSHPFLLMVRAHTHRPVEPTQCKKTSKVTLPWWYMNVGHLGPTHPHYMRKNNTQGWQQALGVIRCKTKYSLDGVNWEADLRRFTGDTGEKDAFLSQGLHPYQVENTVREVLTEVERVPSTGAPVGRLRNRSRVRRPVVDNRRR